MVFDYAALHIVAPAWAQKRCTVVLFSALAVIDSACDSKMQLCLVEHADCCHSDAAVNAVCNDRYKAAL